jgi:nickel/cobalt exporter
MTAKRQLWYSFLSTLVVVGFLATPHFSSAHPLGNFSISHYTAIHLEPDALWLRYIIDMAEIPTFQEIQGTKIVPQESHPSLALYLSQRVEALQAGLLLEFNGQRLALKSESSEMIFPPGAGGLPTLKLGIRFRAQVDSRSAVVNELRYRDTNFPGRAGWKEIIATGGRGIALISSSAPEHDRSDELANYPTDLLNSPPQDLEARVMFAPQPRTPEVAAVGTSLSGTPETAQNQRSSATPTLPQRGAEDITSDMVHGRIQPLRLEVNRQLAPRSSFTELVTAQQLGLGIVLIAMAVSVGLGAFHALEPGHGKTVVAAYLVGSRGTAWHAMILGLIVTVTHTAGVYILGAATLFASRYMVPEHLYPWLGAISGLMIAALGLSLFLRRYARLVHVHAHDQAHGHSHDHEHAPRHMHGPGGAYAHTPGHHAQRQQDVPSTISVRQLLALGVTGGMVPCPAALVVLLSALSLNRVGFGLLLIVAFSIGLAAVLIAIGILMVYAQRLMARFQGDGVLVSRWLPLTSAAVMTVFGVAIAVQALVTGGILQIRL